MMRKDIQGLRAVAVVAVLLFHFWPDRLTGGYVGVDVFFVISGFLITSHLIRKPPVTKKALVDFWARRVKRLIPAATAVLFVTIMASLLWLPETMIQGTLHEAAAAAVYGENWMLAHQATDYLASEDVASPIQHYWSLSIEEQYYLVWPLIIGLTFVASRKLLTSKKLLAIVMAVIFTASLAYSVYLTESNPAAAYFVTPTRVWELTIGGVVALLATRFTVPAKLAAPLSWVGLAMIGAAVLTFTNQTAFPGYTALLPTVGTALVILAATDSIKWSPRRLLGWKPAQFMGDISYSVYLWHWPVVVIAPFALHAEYLVLWQKVLFIIIVIGLAYLTKIYIEDPARSSKFMMKSNFRTYAYGAASMAVVVSLALGVNGYNEVKAVEQRERLEQALVDGTCIGAAAMREDTCIDHETEILTAASMAKNDRSVIYSDGCRSVASLEEKRVCTYGDKNSDTRIALVGNSHASMWHAAIEDIAVRNGWRLDTYLIIRCHTVSAPLDFGRDDLTENCTSWNKWAIESVAGGGYDAVVLTNRTYIKLKGVPGASQYGAQVSGYKQTIDTLLESGVKAFIIRDTPLAVSNAPDCVAYNRGASEKCSGYRKRVLKDDPLYDAALSYSRPDVTALDLSDRFCDETTCYVVIGGIIVYFDDDHMTNTYSKTLAPDIEPSLVEFVNS